MPIDEQTLRKTLRLWASGVTVVTAIRDNERAAMTVSSFASVSLEPPLIIVCLHRDTPTYQLAEATGTFAISILGADQEILSDQFAGFTELPEGEDRFYGVALTTAVTGCPILADAIAWMDCHVYANYEGGTHQIVVGEVIATGRKETMVSPLLYLNRGYFGPPPFLPA